MTHANALLAPQGRQRFVARVVEGGLPIAHVAAEAGAARSTLAKWVARYRADDIEGLEGRSSAPATRPTRVSLEGLELIDGFRCDHKWSARRIHLELTHLDRHCCLRTVFRWLKRLGAIVAGTHDRGQRSW